MQFSLDWLARVRRSAGPARASSRAALTASGSAVEGVESRGRRRAARRRRHHQPPRLHEPLRPGARARGAAAACRCAVPRLRRPKAAPTASSLARVSVERPRSAARATRRAWCAASRSAPSPAWLLRAARGDRPRSINNVVDVTNFVLWEIGQPLHAFDLDAARRGDRSWSRAGARPGEKLHDARRRGARARSRRCW